jgi:hypothetical protein
VVSSQVSSIINFKIPNEFSGKFYYQF